VVKPFSPRELTARVKAVLRRVHGLVEKQLQQPGRPEQSGGERAFIVVHEKRQIRYFGQALTLSKYEYEILSYFLARPGQVFTREQLMNGVWEQPEQSLDRTVDAHVKNLRAKLRAVRPDLDPIVTHRGSGYSLREDL
jgi:two-component system catabolic regulation response regulator CreB